jgi:hypothetical protein
MPSSDAHYLSVRDAVLRWGVRAMPQASGGGKSGAPEPTVNGLLGIPSRDVGGQERRFDLKGLLFGDHL